MNSVDPSLGQEPEPAGPDEQRQLGLEQLYDMLLRRWKLLAAVTVVVLALTIAVTFVMTPLYDATARLDIDPSVRPVTEDDGQSRTTSPQADQARVQTETAIIQSRGIAIQVIKDLNLLADPEFVDDKSRARGGQAALDAAVVALDKATTVKRDQDSYIVSITVRSREADRSAAIANDIMRRYLENSVERRTGIAGEQAKFVDQQLASLGNDIRVLDGRIAQLRAQSGTVEGGTLGTITDQQVAPLSAQLAQSDAEAAGARANLSAAQEQLSRGDGGAVSSVLNSAAITELRRQRAAAAGELAQVDARFGPKHPEAIRARENVASLDAQIREESQRIIASLRATARASDASAASLRGDLSQLRSQQASNSRADVAADALDREAKAKQARYDELTSTALRAGQSQHNEEATAKPVDQAVPPLRPAVPNKPLFAVLGLILGLICGFAAVLIAEFLTTALRSGEDIERRLRIPFLTSVPRLDAAALGGGTPADYVVANSMSSYAEAMRTVRNSLMLSRRKLRVVAILSSLPGEGKTTTSISLGRVMAMSGDRVILVDCDIRRGGMRGIADDQASGGLLAVLNGAIPVEDAIVPDTATGLHVLPLQARSMTPVDLFSGERMRGLLDTLSRRYDFVLLDTAPVLAVADARIIASLADTAVFVAHADTTSGNAARAAVDLVRNDGSHILGGVLTMASRRSSLGSRDPSYYYAQYRAYHKN